MSEAHELPKPSTPETAAKQAKNHVESTPTASKEQTGFANKLRQFINKRISSAELRSSLEESGESPKLEISAKSIPSDEHPGRNEDAMFRLPEKRAFGVFDGMGGHADADKASKLANERIAESLEKLPEGISLQQ